MAKYTLELVEKRNVAENTEAFIFKKPYGFTYIAGQFGEFRVQLEPSKTDFRDSIRSLSIASAPYEDYLMIALRKGNSAFKKEISNLQPGAKVQFEGPYGLFTQSNDTNAPHVFLTGGIGITPVRSIIMQSIKDNPSSSIFIFYSNSRVEDAAFLDELKTIADNYEKFKFIPTITRSETSSLEWYGKKERISKELLQKHIFDFTKPMFYLSGTPEMVRNMREILNDCKVNDDHIIYEEFSGY